MKNGTFSKFGICNGSKGFVLGFIVAAALVAGATYAWNAVWHGTDWITTGEVIDAKKVAENFEYLKQKVDGGQAGSGGMAFVEQHDLKASKYSFSSSVPRLIFIDTKIKPTHPNGDYTYRIQIRDNGTTVKEISFASPGDVDGTGTGEKTKSTTLRLPPGVHTLSYTAAVMPRGWPVDLQELTLQVYNEVGSAQTSTGSLKAGWPDVIECTSDTGSLPGTEFFYLALIESGLVRYASIDHADWTDIQFNASDGTYYGAHNSENVRGFLGCKNKSIQQLQQEGKTFKAFMPW